VTNQAKNYPFEVDIPAGLSVTGVILTDQARSIDWVSRAARFRGKGRPATVIKVQHKLQGLIF